MCKLYCVLEIEDKNKAFRFTEHAIKKILETDNHGLGRIILGDKGLLVNRWLDVKNRNGVGRLGRLEKFSKALAIKANQSGTMSNRIDAIMVHGRYATCEKTLENTHPFVKDGVALIHNGVISNHHAFTKEMSTCDSEVLLHQYLENKVPSHLSNIEKALDGVGGYYACMVANEEKGTVDIWRDQTASLYMAYVPTVGLVVATTMEIILKSARKMKIKVKEIEEIQPCVAIRWHRTGEVELKEFVAKKPFTPTGFTYPRTESIEGKFRTDGQVSGHWWNEETDEEILEQRQLELLQKGKETM